VRKSRLFEEANALKKKIFALTHIQDFSLIQAEKKSEAVGDARKTEAGFVRIEGYDIAHMGGSNMGGVMVVLEDSHIKKSDYRLFKIKRQKGADDTAALKEVLSRRLNHTEWHFPTCIVVDGGKAQKNAVEAVLKEAGFDIAVVSVVKDNRHKPNHFLGDEALIEKYRKEILLVNSEAHRFAVKYHRKMQRKTSLPNS
jgi:excinuclease ABC subunit C